MIEEDLGEIVVRKKLRKRTRQIIINADTGMIDATRARERLSGDGVIESSSYPVQFPFDASVAQASYAGVTGAQVYAFIRDLLDARDPITAEELAALQE